MNEYKELKEIYTSRRGNYQLVEFPFAIQNASLLEWKPEPLGDSKRDLEVMDEIRYARQGRLAEHRYWANEPKSFVDEYSKLYTELFELNWLHKKEDRHNIVVNSACCLTLVQYNNGVLHAYSRSTDMRNGYYSDKLILDYLAQTINTERRDCEVIKISWQLAVPHVYVHPGIARLQEPIQQELELKTSTKGSRFVRGYKQDAGVDMVLEEDLVIQPGFQTITLDMKYTPGDGEVAFLISRGSTARKGIFPIMVAIDTGFTGYLSAWVINVSGMVQIFPKGDRVFGVVNLKLGEDRVDFAVAKEGKRGENKLASSGGNTNGNIK